MNSNKRKGGAEEIREKKMKLLASVVEKCTKIRSLQNLLVIINIIYKMK